ncbi:MAG TPA: MarR family winged helix-turn-helix transcriptional regulator [Xanthobacteraceae bacterium]|jgi:DNA-binding MarR family transcriptional regulator|nr:MarR family winged helix-turn-helix transcriptional regulator [Xanthobacteraceae bacterium]
MSRATLDPRPKNSLTATYLLEEQIGFLLRIAMQRHTNIFTSEMIESLTAPQFSALVKLMQEGPLSQNHLGRLIYLDVATIKGVVERLRARGLVTSKDDPRDARRHTIALTAAGRRLVEAAIPIAVKITAKTLDPLSEKEQETLLHLLKKLG